MRNECWVGFCALLETPVLIPYERETHIDDELRRTQTPLTRRPIGRLYLINKPQRACSMDVELVVPEKIAGLLAQRGNGQLRLVLLPGVVGGGADNRRVEGSA